MFSVCIITSMGNFLAVKSRYNAVKVSKKSAVYSFAYFLLTFLNFYFFEKKRFRCHPLLASFPSYQ